MLTNGTATPENYYHIKFANEQAATYAYGVNALQAITIARQDTQATGNATARPAVYGEWDCWPECFTNDGNHNHNRRPTPITK